MIQKLTQAKRLVEAFIALMVGRTARIHWDASAGMDSEGGIHLPPPKTGDAAEIALLTRLAVHEGGHLLETEQGFADRLSQEELIIFNCLEDPRMENRQVRRYPGASLVLSRGLDEMLQRIEDRLDETVMALPERAVHLDMLMRGFLAVAPHGPFARRAPAMLQRIAPHISQAQRTAVDETVARLPMLSTSLDAEVAARRFLARLRELETSPPQDSTSEQQQNQSEEQQQQDRQQDQQDQQDPFASEGAGKGEQNEGQSQPNPAEASRRDEQQPEGGGDRGGEPNAGDRNDTAGGAGANGEEPSGNDPTDGTDAGRDPATQSVPRGAGQPESEGPAAQEQDDQAGNSQRSEAGTGKAANAESNSGGAAEAGPGQGGVTEGSEADAGPPATTEQPGAHLEPKAAQPQQDGDFDLGQLLREAHVARYGASEPAQDAAATEQAGAALTDAELQRVAALLAQAADPSAPLEELLQASLVALAAGETNEASESATGGLSAAAGMSLARVPAGPVTLIETRLQGVQSRLVTVLQRELQDKRRRPTRAAYGGRVMPQRVWRLGALGDTKVFVQRHLAGGIDAAATVLLDSSESMELQLTVAAEVTMAFSLALQRLGVRTRVVRFPGVETVTETIQRFGESARACVHRCAELKASGGTPVGAAVALETPALLQQRKLKNVLAVVTDDAPGDKAALAAALQRADELDILVVGVGIGCDIRMWIPHSVSVRDVNELPDALATLFRENISEKLAA